VARLIPCSGAEAVRKFHKAGWSKARQKGSHVMMVKKGFQWTVSIPQHKELGPGLLRKLLRVAEMSVETFNGL